MAEILAVLKSSSATVSGIVFIVAMIAYLFKKSPDQVNQEIDQKVEEEKHKAEETGRPV